MLGSDPEVSLGPAINLVKLEVDAVVKHFGGKRGINDDPT